MGAPLRGDKLVRFGVPGGATFNSKMTTKILNCPYLRDCLSYKLEIGHKVCLCLNDKFCIFWTPGGTTFSFKLAAKILSCPYLGDYWNYKLEIWHKDSSCSKDKFGVPKTNLVYFGPEAEPPSVSNGRRNIELSTSQILFEL